MFSETGQEKSAETSPKIGIKFRGGGASANIFQTTKLDKSFENRNIYTEIQNCYSKNPNSESSNNSAKTAIKSKKSSQTEAATNKI